MKNILILGGTGKTGRRIAGRLRAAGRPVRTASRTGGDIGLDLDDPNTWAPALDGVTAAYIIEPNLQAASTDRQARIPRLVTEAVAAGVQRLVLLSAAAPTTTIIRSSPQNRPCAAPAWSGPSCGRPGSRRTSARTPGGPASSAET